MKRQSKLQNTKASQKEKGEGSTRKQKHFSYKALDKNSFVPMYFQIQNQLLDQIQSGRLQAGDLLPGEDELSRAFGVSRMTTRQSMQALKSQGFAQSQRGRGTFVLQPKVEKQIAHLSGFTAEMRSLGIKPATRTLGQEIISATPELAPKLAIALGASVLELRRLRLADAVPMAIEHVWLPLAAFPGIGKIDFSHCSLYETFRKRYGIVAGCADEIIEARRPTRSEAELLEISTNVSLLIVSRIVRTASGDPVEASISFYRGDRYRAVLRVPASMVE